jgi:hypothetical protein
MLKYIQYWMKYDAKSNIKMKLFGIEMFSAILKWSIILLVRYIDYQ